MPKQSARDRRIEQGIIVDCYDPDEQAMGWYYYLEGRQAVEDWLYWVDRGFRF